MVIVAAHRVARCSCAVDLQRTGFRRAEIERGRRCKEGLVGEERQGGVRRGTRQVRVAVEATFAKDKVERGDCQASVAPQEMIFFATVVCVSSCTDKIWVVG